MANLDRFFPVSPIAASAKAGNRSNASAIGSRNSNRKYEGADRGKRAMGFPVNNLSPNKDIGQDATLLRQRSRYLYQNTVDARRAINSFSNGAVGTGILPTIITANTRAKENIKQLWETFGETHMCDFNGRLDFYGLTHLIEKTTERDGECLILRRRVPFSESITGMQYQILEMEYVADYINYQVLPGGGYTMHGIQYDKRGKVEGYWLFSRHPSEWYTQPELIPAVDVLHPFDVDYPGQGRGASKAAPTIIEQQDLKEYELAELVGKKVQASHALFRVTNDPEKIENIDPENYDSDEDLEKVEPGTIYHLFPGETIVANTPPTSPGAEDFRKSKKRSIAAGYEVTYEMMTGDYSNVNFSSGRMGWIEHSRSLEHAQWMKIIPAFCRRAFNWFLEQVPLTPGSIVTSMPKDLKVLWTPPKREMLDPVKETNANIKQVRAGFKAPSEVIKSQGDNPDDVFKQIAADIKKLKELGIHVESLQDLDLILQVQKNKEKAVENT